MALFLLRQLCSVVMQNQSPFDTHVSFNSDLLVVYPLNLKYVKPADGEN